MYSIEFINRNCKCMKYSKYCFNSLLKVGHFINVKIKMQINKHDNHLLKIG